MGDWPDISLMTLLLSVKQIQPEEGRDGEWRGMEGLLNMVLFSESAHRQSLRFLYGLFGGFCLRAEFLRQPGYFPPGTLLSLFFRMCCTYTHFWFHTQPHELARSERASSVWSCVWVGVSSHSAPPLKPKEALAHRVTLHSERRIYCRDRASACNFLSLSWVVPKRSWLLVWKFKSGEDVRLWSDVVWGNRNEVQFSKEI